MRTTSQLTRRSLLAGGSLLVGGLLLDGCANDRAGSSPSESADQTWTFVDDRKQTITLPARPDTLVAFSTATAALAELGIKPAGIFTWHPIKDDTQLRFADVTGMEVIGETYGELNLELLSKVAPQVIITSYDSTDNTLYGISEEQRAKVEAIAPVLGLDNTAPLLTQFDRFQELGRALGGDLGSVDLLEQRQRFNDLSQQIEAAAKEKPGLKIMAVADAVDGIMVAQPKPNPDLTYYGGLGLDFVVPKGDGIFWWQELAAEQIDTYPADVILVDARDRDATRASLEKLKLWPKLPAVRAGQVFDWHAYDPPTYKFYNDALVDLLTAVQKSKVVS
ncbi:MAG: ABC transporter substrate-binding protein [Microlunatus sp.]